MFDEFLADLEQMVLEGRVEDAVARCQAGLRAGVSPLQIYSEGLRKWVRRALERIERGAHPALAFRTYRWVRALYAVLEPHIRRIPGSPRGKVVTALLPSIQRDFSYAELYLQLIDRGANVYDLGEVWETDALKSDALADADVMIFWSEGYCPGLYELVTKEVSSVRGTTVLLGGRLPRTLAEEMRLRYFAKVSEAVEEVLRRVASR